MPLKSNINIKKSLNLGPPMKVNVLIFILLYQLTTNLKSNRCPITFISQEYSSLKRFFSPRIFAYLEKCSESLYSLKNFSIE